MVILDWLCNKQIPASTDRIVIVRPSAGTFINGVSRGFSEEFDPKLESHISHADYK